MRRLLLLPLLLAVPAGARAADAVIDSASVPVTRPADPDSLDRRFRTAPSLALRPVDDCRLDAPPSLPRVRRAVLAVPATETGLVPAIELWLRRI